MSVNYPVDITLTSPAAESFRPGATVTIGSDWSLNSGWDLTANNDAVTIAGTGTFAIGAHAGGDVCVFVCEEYSFVPSFDLPGGALDDDGIVVNELSGEIFSIDIPAGSYDIHDSFADFAGVSGSFGFPDTSPEGTLDDDGKTISAEDTSHYLDLAIDIDEWALYFASKVKKLKGLKNVNLEGDFSEVDTASQGGATVEFEIADLKYNLDEYQTKTFEFTATPQITLALPESLAWVVKTTNGSQVDSGTSSSVTFDAGNQIELTMPNDLSGNMSITPTFTLSNENESATLTGSFLDPGSLDAHTVVITWGLGEGSTTLSLVTGERSFSASHQYLDDAPAGTDADIYPITVEVSDDDTGSGDGGTSVLVSNVDPSGIVLKSPVIDENGTATVTGDFEDPGSLDIHSVLIVWGPNEGTTTLNLAPGARSFAASHQ